jgi:hypothetical protein
VVFGAAVRTTKRALAGGDDVAVQV